MRINAILPEETVNRLDDISKKEKKSRSNILREAAEKYIKEHEEIEAERIRKEQLYSAIQTQDMLREKSERWDGVGEVRKWRELRK